MSSAMTAPAGRVRRAARDAGLPSRTPLPLPPRRRPGSAGFPPPAARGAWRYERNRRPHACGREPNVGAPAGCAVLALFWAEVRRSPPCCAPRARGAMRPHACGPKEHCARRTGTGRRATRAGGCVFRRTPDSRSTARPSSGREKRRKGQNRTGLQRHPRDPRSDRTDPQRAHGQLAPQTGRPRERFGETETSTGPR